MGNFVFKWDREDKWGLLYTGQWFFLELLNQDKWGTISYYSHRIMFYAIRNKKIA